MRLSSIQNRQHRTRTLYYILALLLTALVFTQPLHANTDQSAKQSRLNENIAEYQEQIQFIDMEIDTLKTNLRFLQVKIDRMKIQSRQIPEKMKLSVIFKKNKIETLTSLREYYWNLLNEEKRTAAAISPPKKMVTKSRPASQPIEKQNEDHKKPLAKNPTPSIKKENYGGNQIVKQIHDAGLSNWLAVLSQGNCTCLETRLPILFSSGSAKIPKGYQSFLKKLAQFIKDYDVRILVKGYADTDPINTRQYPSNLELGASRASAIARALMHYGIKPSVFEVASTGEYRFTSKVPVKWKKLQRHAVIRILFPDCRKP